MVGIDDLKKAAEAAVKAAVFFTSSIAFNLGEKRPYSGMAGFKNKKTGVVLVSQKLVAQKKEHVEEFFKETSGMELAWRVTEGKDRSTDATDELPRLEYYLTPKVEKEAKKTRKEKL